MTKSEAELRSIFSQRLSEIIKEQKIVQRELAEALNCAPGLINHWKKGKSLPKVLHLNAIAEYTGVSVDYLLGRTTLSQASDLGQMVRIMKDQLEADEEIKDFIVRHNPKEIYLIQYSAINVSNILKLFRDTSCKIYLLVKHPGKVNDTADPNIDKVAPLQRNKILAHLETLLDADNMRGNPNAKIKCYWFPGAMRATYIGTPLGERLQKLDPNLTRTERDIGLLSLSMYRYVEARAGVIGELNPLIHVYSNLESGKKLYHLFEETFLELWENSIPAEQVLDAIRTTSE
jgi:transcriptional regulator with XRE-family HTH domain